MPEFTNVITSQNQPKYQFFHAGQEYLIYTLVDSDLDVGRMCLAIPYEVSSGNFTPDNKVAEYATSSILSKAGGTKLFMENVFLPKVNAYLLEQGEPSQGDTFPVDGSVLEQFTFMVENSLTYSNGKINLVGL